MSQAIETLHFEDCGQDFLEWDLDDQGVVVACRPFQEFVWLGASVTGVAENAQPVVTAHGDTRVLNYRILRITKPGERVERCDGCGNPFLANSDMAFCVECGPALGEPDTEDSADQLSLEEVRRG